MAKNLANDMYGKVEEVLFTDKLRMPNKINDILSSEIFYVLKQFFDIREESFSSHIFIEQNGEISISFSFKAKRVLIKRGAEVKQ